MNISLKKFMFTSLVILFVLVLGVVVLLVVQGQQSKSGTPPGLVNNQLIKCPQKKNCVCSEYSEDTRYYIEPIPLSTAGGLSRMKSTIESMGGDIHTEKDHYLAATFTSSLFGFVDDLEIRVDTATDLVHVRSASRVGDSDLGVNRKRVEQLKNRLSGG